MRFLGRGFAGFAASARQEGELVQVRIAAAARADECDVQLVVEILAPQKRRRPGDDAGRGQDPADKLAARYLT